MQRENKYINYTFDVKKFKNYNTTSIYIFKECTAEP